ncbi:MAG: Maf family protein, partial [Bacteroidaceae bacterium]
LTPVEAAIHLSQLKANSAKSILSDDTLVIAADTVVFANDKILGKPKDRHEALQMLHMLTGKSHTVVTGVTLGTLEKSVSFAETTEVFFKKLDNSDIERYIDMCRPFDKAGSYGIQEWIGLVGVEKIVGCHYNVMGLPTSRLYEELKKFDVFPC